MSTLRFPHLQAQPVSVTRKMSASLPRLRKLAESNGLSIHHLGAGYPHPEVTDPRQFIERNQAYLDHLTAIEGLNDPEKLPEHLREAYAYGDTLGPLSTRRAFAEVYGGDWSVAMDVNKLIPTIGATGGISLCCSLFERPGEKIAYLTDAPTYAGFLARAKLNQHAQIFSVELDDEGPVLEMFVAQLKAARDQGFTVPFYYTIPDGHNPAGFSFSQARREAIVEIARQEGLLILEDAPYLYINYQNEASRAQPFISLAPEQTLHLFTGSKIGLPGPRVAFIYSEAKLQIHGAQEVDITELLLVEASGDLLFHNPAALRGFESILHDDDFKLRSLWDVAEDKLAIYTENREILLSGLTAQLGGYRDLFSWTKPQAGFFSVFTFLSGDVVTDDEFIERLVAEYGVVVIPMYDFYPEDARSRNPRAGFDQVRLSFCFNEAKGQQRRDDLKDAVAAFCAAAMANSGK